jgi:hypothetical protein
MSNQSFQYSITTSRNETQVFAYLLNPENWWSGLFDETIEGKSKVINDEFSFSAGNGMHFSIQKLIELELDRKIVWLVTESNLSFLDNTNEWAGTRICFEIEKNSGNTTITFTHDGLYSGIDCYDTCSSAWTQYLQNLQEHFN